jgi:SAM-dependent methyltransferase
MIPTEIEVFPSIETELADVKPLLKGRVLNAGAGWRDLSHLIDGELVNQDIPLARDKRNYGFWHDHIPVESCYFDTILCIAVLEHVENPYRVLSEFYRVLKTGATILDVPFLQPKQMRRITSDIQSWVSQHYYRTVFVL